MLYSVGENKCRVSSPNPFERVAQQLLLQNCRSEVPLRTSGLSPTYAMLSDLEKRTRLSITDST